MAKYGRGGATGINETHWHFKLYGGFDIGFAELRKDSAFRVAD